MNIRVLSSEDIEAFRALRLRGLLETPEAFGTTADEFRRETPAQFLEYLQIQRETHDDFVIGAFDDQQTLVGIVGFRREVYEKQRNRGRIWGMYVVPEVRGQGVGRLLMVEMLRTLQTIEGLEQVHLSAVTSNVGARRLYTSLGFQVYGLEPYAMKWGGEYWDEELMIYRWV